MSKIYCAATILLFSLLGCQSATQGTNYQNSKSAEAFLATCAATDVEDIRFRVVHHPAAQIINPTAVFELQIDGRSLQGGGEYAVDQLSTEQAPDGRTEETFVIKKADIPKIKSSWDEARSCIRPDFEGDLFILVGLGHDLDYPNTPEISDSPYTSVIYNANSGELLGPVLEERLRD